ncbi:MAG TPA: PEP/pyruvate-binding domain-containing protein, partial [Thermodesulfovibrionales bacterium]|nr:PEP/pyruvate-binding domain-containing protein [Thermodesulfovibrionales bacterium]
MPLTNLQGKHVDKYRFFRNFLSHNRSALNAIADMEQMYYSGRPFSLTASMVRYQELSEAAMGALYALDSLSHGKFPSLPDIFGKIEAEISEEFNPHLSLMTTDVVLALENVAPEMKNIVGAKTATLASIKNTLALPVPRGFAITAYAFERFLEESGLSKPIREELSKIPSLDSLHAMRRISGTLRAMILEATVPQSVADEIMKSYEALEKKTAKDIKIALRSSAIGEDSEASFAGQYASVLNVAKEDILDAYKNVVASKYSNRAINYRFQYGLRDRETPMAVLAIEMVDALASGVVYTLSPLPGESRAVKISSVWGLGEYLVSGTASPDTFLVERAGALITERTISRKEHEILSMESGGTGLVGVAEGKRDLPSIDDGAVFKLRDYGLMLEEFFGAPQDIEWAIDRKGNLYILQSRPLNLPKISDDDRIVKKDYPGNPVLISNGKTASLGIASGRIFIARQKGDLDGIPEHAILVAKTASPDYAR